MITILINQFIKPNKIEKDFADISEKDKFIINENHLKNIDSVMINSIYIL